MTRSKRIELREEARDMFYHAYEGYLDHAFPADELMPQSCKGRWRFPDGHAEHRGALDDGFGNYSLTLIDTLDSLVVMGDLAEFERAIRLVVSSADFDRDITVNVFETTIRTVRDCDGEKPLLDLAVDLADRLLPAFKTQTGIPYARINLRSGVPRREPTSTCLAGAGTLLLEFGTLSRLTSDPEYERAAANAVHAIWQRREPRTNLVGGLIDVQSGKWLGNHAGIGAGSDSFYEYLLKSYILLGEPSYLHMFNKSYEAIQRFMKQGDWYLDVQMSTGSVVGSGVDSLQAFFPGVQVLNGDIAGAVETHSTFYGLWKRYGSMPESYNIKQGQPPRHLYKGYPLRPEFIESTLMLYHATRDPFYLEIGEQVLSDLQRTKTNCGFAAVADVETGRLEDRMDSYFLSETCKYLFLLFDEDNEFMRASDIIFSTEAHILPIFTSSPAWSRLHKPITTAGKSSASEGHPGAEALGVCEALTRNGAHNSAGSRQANPKAVLSAMFDEYRQAQLENEAAAMRSPEAELDEESMTDADFASLLTQAINRQASVESSVSAKANPIPQPQLSVESAYSVTLWGNPFIVYAVSGAQRYQGNVILRVVDSSNDTAGADDDEAEAIGAYEAGDDERWSGYSSWADDNGDEEDDVVDYDETAGENQEPPGNDAANNTSTLEVAAVQALFGPFFSSLVGHSFELIYVPHELCPDQGFHIDANDSFGRVVLVPRGGCNFADKAKELHRFNVAGMLVFNTNPDEPALEMTAADMDVPLPSAMVNYSDAMLLRRELALRPDGVLVMEAYPDEPTPSSNATTRQDKQMVVDQVALTNLLENYFKQQNQCEDANCLHFINPGMPIVIDIQSIPLRPAEEADTQRTPAPSELGGDAEEVQADEDEDDDDGDGEDDDGDDVKEGHDCMPYEADEEEQEDEEELGQLDSIIPSSESPTQPMTDNEETDDYEEREEEGLEAEAAAKTEARAAASESMKIGLTHAKRTLNHHRKLGLSALDVDSRAARTTNWRAMIGGDGEGGVMQAVASGNTAHDRPCQSVASSVAAAAATPTPIAEEEEEMVKEAEALEFERTRVEMRARVKLRKEMQDTNYQPPP